MSKTDHLGEFEQLALLAVMRLGKDAWGTSIQRELDTRGGRSASISTIYITLTRLEKKGLVESHLEAGGAGRGGKPRRYFTLQPAGLAALGRSRESLLGMWSGLETTLDAATNPTHGG